MSKEKFVRNKPHCNIGTIGHVDQNFIGFGGGGRIRTFEDRSQRVYSPPHLTALVPLRYFGGYRYNKALFNKVL